jgi:TonB-dependent starch-binding outer membrane protein SusC
MESSGITKTLLVMRLTALILLAGGLQVAANGFSQTTITLSKRDASLEEVLTEISRQSGYNYFFADQLENQARRVNIEVSKAPLEAALNLCFQGQPFSYSIFRRTIVIRQKRIEENRLPTPSVLPRIAGIVRNEKMEPLAGASVSIENSHRGTSTNDRGLFELTNIPADAKIEVSYAGYQTKESLIQGNLYLEITLAVSNSSLDQVQVIAYGTTTERLGTGDVSTVRAADIEKQPVSNPLLALEGRVPGMLITQSTGLPGTGVMIQIRGLNSIGNGNDPFYVIDGIPYPSQLLPNLGIGLLGNSGAITSNPGTSGSPLSFINPSDIESISVLKDAAATAIYGSRAANGAILITTKRGKAGRMKAEINLQNGWGHVPHELSLLNTQQYIQMRHQAINNDGVIPSLQNGDFDLLQWDTTRSTDWQKKLIGGTSQYTQLSTTFSGGNESAQYLIGGTYHRETTVFPGNFSDQKGSLHVNINTVSENQKFHIQLFANCLIDNNQLPTTDLTYTAINLAPDAPKLYNTDGSLNWEPTPSGASTWYNPLAYLNGYYSTKTTNLISNLTLSYQVLPGLVIKSSFGYTNMQTNELFTNSLLSLYPENRPFAQRSALYGNNNIHSWIIEPQAIYNRTIGKSKFDALIGTTAHQNNSDGQQFSGIGYNSDQVVDDIRSASTITAVSSIASLYKYSALFGRMGYNWNDKYLITITARRDGSSRFGPASQFHNFGAAGIGWIFSKEIFFQRHIPFLSFGKFRLSYGTTGNDQIGDYKFMSLYSPVGVGVAYQGAVGLSPNSLFNPSLQWEETKKLEGGLDLGAFKDRILFSASYYRNRSSNQLLSYSLPIISGFGSISRNFPATIQNTGLEFSFKTINIKRGSVEWFTNINFTMPQNKLVTFPNLASSSSASFLVIGQPLTIIHGLHFLGVDPATGTYQFADSHGHPTSSPDFSTDATVLINTSPKFYGGFQNSFRYKGFEFDLLFQFVKQKGLTYFYGNFPGIAGTNQPSTILKAWNQPGDAELIQRYNSNFSLGLQSLDIAGSDAAYRDASYISLKNLSVTWQFPARWVKGSPFKELRLYVQGQNLLTLTNYIGLNPVTSSVSGLPPLRVLTMGINAGL